MTTYTEAATQWIDGLYELAPTTIETYRSTLKLFGDHVGKATTLGTISRDEIEAYMGKLKRQNKAASTMGNRLSCLRSFFAWAEDHGMIDDDPTRKVKSPKPKRAVARNLDHTSVDAVLANAVPRTRLMVLLAAQLGLRRAEIASIEVGKINLATREMTVLGKGDIERRLPLTDQAFAEIVAWIGGHDLNKWLFPSNDSDQHVTPRRVGRLVSDACKRAGVPATTHMFRHTAASDVLEQTGNVRLVQEMLGHASMATTTRYLGTTTTQLREAMEGRTYGAVDPENEERPRL